MFVDIWHPQFVMVYVGVFKTGPASEPENFWVMGHCGRPGLNRVDRVYLD